MSNQLITVDSNFMRLATAEREQLIAQRDQLLSAAKAAYSMLQPVEPYEQIDKHPGLGQRICHQLRAAIAAAESKEQSA